LTIAGLVDSFIFNGAKKLKGEQDSGFGGPGGKMVRLFGPCWAALIYSCKLDILHRHSLQSYMHKITRSILRQSMLNVFLGRHLTTLPKIASWLSCWAGFEPRFRITAVLYMHIQSRFYCVKAKRSPSPNLALCILISSTGLSLLSVLTASNL
jgi:hypothetical protein